MLRGLVDWIRARSFWQKVGLIVLLSFVALSIWNGYRRAGGTQLVSGSAGVGASTGAMTLVRGRLDGGLLYATYQGGLTDGIEIDGMAPDGSRGTVTLFGRVSRTYADIATCTAGFSVAEDGAIEGRIRCPEARTTDGGGGATSLAVAFSARTAATAPPSGG